ncbi:DUF6152 family protein [Pelagibacterium mangrovi]|uniref:DUF6152 family protein n=1 Tax=Pelagibacterium mangrovi TaxID=3119828 RepID=UPI002FCBD13E
MTNIATMTFAGVLALGALGAGSALAHHSAAMFDDAIEMELTGVVTEFDYLNPHSWLYVEVTDEDGSVTAWGFELDDPSRLRRQGITPTYWEPGDMVTVITNPLRDGRPAGHLVGAIKADGATFGNVEGLVPPTVN